MTKEETLAFEYGWTFDPANVPAGYAVAPCFDSRMNNLISESRSKKGIERNTRNMAAWYNGQAARKEHKP